MRKSDELLKLKILAVASFIVAVGDIVIFLMAMSDINDYYNENNNS